jgi:hypothetical protein
MPWMIVKKGGRYQVRKQGADGEPTGGVLGTHDTEAEAKQQLAALYASEPGAKAVKFAEGSDTDLLGLLAPNGGPFNGSDIQHERFTTKTDFCLPWFNERPLLYQHGLDPEVGTEVVGRIKSLISDDIGLWMKGQLDKGSKYYQAIKKLIEQGALQLSSGAMPHLTKVAKTGDILRWPLVEGTLTPTPANPFATVDFATAKAHFKAIDIDLESEPLKAMMDAAMMDALPDSDFAYIDSEGGRHLPMNDAAHACNAVARFDQTSFDSPAAKKKAWRKLMARCQEMDVEVSQDVMDAHKSFELKAAPDSYEELIEMLGRLVNPFNPFGQPDLYVHVCATFSDYCIVKRHQAGEETTWKVPYSLDSEGRPVLGTPTEVEESYVPVSDGKSYLPETSLTTQADTVAHYAAALVERTKGLNERRTKEGRVLSTATRNRLANCVQTMQSAASELQGLLDSTDPAKAKAAEDFGRLSLDIDLLEFEAALTA